MQSMSAMSLDQDAPPYALQDSSMESPATKQSRALPNLMITPLHGRGEASNEGPMDRSIPIGQAMFASDQFTSDSTGEAEAFASASMHAQDNFATAQPGSSNARVPKKFSLSNEKSGQGRLLG